ncbi:MAG: T9SS type A sorting domain-containing protein, partial [Sediminibacterium sp.]|nr:T9SS type A sorting domain-containing protein [Sediminibacterium sp.]
GVLGTTPSFGASVTVNDNLPFQYDFRSVYATILSNWLCVNDADLQQVMLKNYQTLPLVNAAACKKAVNLSGEKLISNYPNPFTSKTVISFKTAGGHTLIQIIDTSGRVIANLTDQLYAAGTFTVQFDSANLPSGIYYARLQNLATQQICTMIKVR